MPLEKGTIDFNFSQGMDTLSDPNQMPLGKFTSLENTVFTKDEGAGELNKRPGIPSYTSAPDATSRVLSNFRDNLLAVGDKLSAYSAQTNSWIGAGTIQPLELNVLPLSRNFYAPTVIDSAQAPNGLICVAYTAPNPLIPISNSFYYSIYNQSGQVVVAQTTPVGVTSPQKSSRVYYLDNKFVIVFNGVSGSATLEYISINTNTLAVAPAQTLQTGVNSTSTIISFDGSVSNNKLYLAFSSRGNISAATINSAMVASSVAVIGSGTASLISVCLDTSTGTTMFASWVPTFNTLSAKMVATNEALTPLFSAQNVVSSGGIGIVNVTSAALGGIANAYFEIGQRYTYDVDTPTNFITTASLTTSGSISNEKSVVRSVGLASKAFVLNSYSCFMSMYTSAYQSTFFLHANTFSQNFQVPNNLQVTTTTIAKLAQGNAYSFFSVSSTYYLQNPPSISINGSQASVAYLLTTNITPVNKDTNVGSANLTAAVFTSQGLNYASFDFGTKNFQTKEIGNTLNTNGGLLWAYDGNIVTEQNFLLYPDNIKVVGSGGGGLAVATYFYQVLYQWTDAQGNIQRSAPSIPLKVTLGSGTGQILISIPCLRLGAKPVSNSNGYNPATSPVVISIYRWSTNQQVYYKIGPSIVQDTSALSGDSITTSDSQSDAQIIGNEIIYTNGGVVEDVNPAAPKALTIFDSRLWMVDAEDENLLWFSKSMSEGAPVEMSDLLTYFVPPDIAGLGNTGGVKALGAMDDKLILFKKNSIFYVGGTGPDITGANNQYSSAPIFITAGVGCVIPTSVVLVPMGIMFQSDKGIWIIGRDLVLNYIGKEVEDFNDCRVVSAVNVPATNEVRFTLGSSGQTLVYDYFASQWNKLTNVPAVHSTVNNNSFTTLNVSGSVSQQSLTSFTDAAGPTQMGFTTGWINLAGVQGYVRAYRMYILGTFYSPHTYTVGIAYDYNPSIKQTATIVPTNVVGSGSMIEQWQVNLTNQQCESFRLTFNEISSGSAGQGLSISGFKLVYGRKKDFPRNIPAKNKTS